MRRPSVDGDTYGNIADVAVSLLLGALIVVALVQSMDWPLGARLFPQIVGAIFLGVLMIRLGQRLGSSERKAEEVMDISHDEEFSNDQYWRYGLRAWMWVAGYILLAALIGIGLASPAFLLVYLIRVARIRWWAAVLMTVAIAVLLVGVFDGLMQIRFPAGVLLEGTL